MCVRVLTMWRTHIFLAKITADDGRKLIVKTGEKTLCNLCQMFAPNSTLREKQWGLEELLNLIAIVYVDITLD